MTDSILCGTDDRLRFELTDDNGDPYPHSELNEVKWGLGTSRSPGGVVLEKTLSGGEIETIDGEDGHIDVVLDPSDTTNLDVQQYREELAVSTGDGFHVVKQDSRQLSRTMLQDGGG